MNKEGAVAGMVVGMVAMLFYMLKFKFDMFGGGTSEDWWFGISPEGFGTVAMLLNFIVSIIISLFTPDPLAYCRSQIMEFVKSGCHRLKQWLLNFFMVQ